MLMKRISTLLVAAAFSLVCSMQAWSANITMPMSYAAEPNATVTVTEESTLTYSGYWAESETSNPVSVHLVPAAGQTLRVTCTQMYGFDTCNAELKVYNGAASISYSLPAGDMGAVAEGKVFESTAADGSLTVAYSNEEDEYVKYSFKVELVAGGDMEYTATEAVSLPNPIIGASLQPVAAANVKTAGASNALSATQVAFVLNDASAVSGARIYYSKKAPFNISEAGLFGASKVDGTTVTATGSLPLAAGDNYFWLVGDVSTTAAVGSAITAQCTSVKIGGEEKITSPVASTVTVGNELNMPSAGTFAIGASGLNFYDDGGKDGKISSKFEGVVTFKPTTPGKVVQIDFSKVELYESTYGSDSYNDKIKVYNGTTVSDANLNAQVMNGKPVVLRSSAADGSLTVWMKSVTGDYYRGKGFEAFVSEYSPAPMTVKTVTTAQVADNTSTAGSTDQPILSVCVKTENTEAVNATKLTFETEGTTDINHLQKATVYYTAKSSTFATATKLGEAVPTGKQEFSIAFDQQLVEGENWFWLAYDIDPKAQTGEILDAGCKSIEIGGASYTPATVNPDGNSSVKNELLSTVGTVEKTIYGTWTFKNTPNPYVGNNGYEPVIGDQITTFIPGDNDMIVELDIKSFALYYSANANYPRAKFEVYSGKGTTGELLWSLTGEADKNVGPGKILRSKSVDGALTVVFDAKTETSGYTAKGWDAEVREYRQRPMEVSSVKATQASTDIVNKGAVNQELLGVDIQTAGNISPVVLKGIKFNMKGCQANVAKLHVYTSGQKNELTKETSIADIDVTAETTEANITFARPLELAEGSNYFWLTADIADEAATDADIDAAVTAVTTATATINVDAEQGDPEGARTVKNTYNLQAGDNGEIVVGNEALMFYDNGGADGKSPKNFEGQVTFRPKDAGKVVKLTFKSFSTSYNDNFYIYYGGKKTSTPDVKVSKMLEAPIVSVADDGKLTVYFKCPSYSYASNGWAIEVSQYELLPLSVGNMAITSVAASESLRGSKNVPMLRAEATIDGDKGEMDFSKFVVSADGSAEGTIAAAKIFVTTTDQFSANNLIGSANTAPFEIATDYKATAPGKYYFWVAYDFNADAAEGNLGTAALTAYTANGAETSTMASITAQTAMKAGKKGVYTVGEGGDYATIQAAVDDIATGIEGAVTVNILSGEYNEKVNIPEIPGASDVNTVTIQSATGNYGDVKIFHNAYTDPGYNTDKYGVVTFNGADYVTLRGVTVTSTDKTFPALVYMINTSQHDTVDACHLYTDRIESTTTAEQLVLVRQLAIDKENCNNDYFTLSNCLLEGGYRGAIIGGTSYVALTHQTGCVVEGNTFRNNAASALSAYSGDNNITIRGNVIENNTTTLSRGFNGFDLQFGDNCIVEGNTMHIDLGVEAIGIYVRKGASTADKRSRIVNNEVSVKSSDYTSAAIKVNGKTPNVDIAYNTAVVAGHENNVACYLNDAMEAMTVRNNIFLARDNGLVYRTYKDADAAAITFSNNVLHTNGTVFAQTSSNTKLASFSDWMLKVNEQSSFNEDVAFLSDKMLFPAAAGNLLNAMPLDFVTTDLLGAVRNATTPTIGAYEYADASAVPAFDEGYPAISGISHNAATAVLKTAANGKAYLMVKESSETAPTADEMKASTLTATLRAGKEVSVSLNGLSSQTAYRLYTLLESLDGTNVGVVAATDAFTTTYLPTEVSTFENVKANDSGFDDGTASFAGFTVVDADDAVVEGTKVAKIEGAGAVQLTNTDKGLTLTGFFVKTDAEVAMNVYDGNADAHAYTIPATSGKWIFFNLKDKGAVTALDFATEGNAYIDNFSGEPLPLTAACTTPQAAVASGAKADLKAEFDGGVYPVAVEWKNAMREVVANGDNTATPALDRSGVFYMTATDAWGNTATDAAVVYVTGNQFAATMDDNFLAPESFYNGLGKDDPSYTNPGTSSQFVSGSFAFDTERHTSTWWGGFALSNQTGTVFESYADQFKSAVGSGHNSANYAVVYSYTGANYAANVTNAADGADVSGFYVTNTANNVNAYVNGDGMSTAPGGFAKGDWFKMTVNVVKADDTTASIDYYLADYRADNEADHYYLDTWQWVDLRQFGKIKKMTFGFEGTKRNASGLTTPTYACLDDFGGNREISDAKKALAGITIPATVDLQTLFNLDNDNSTVTYAIVDNCDAAKATMAIADGILTISGLTDKTETSAVVSATQKGKIQFVNIPVEIDEEKASVNDVAVDADVRIFPVPATDRLNIRTAMTDYAVRIYATNGSLVMEQLGNNGSIAVPVNHLAKGVYILTIDNAQQSSRHRVVVK